MSKEEIANEIRERLARGENKKQILDALVEEHSLTKNQLWAYDINIGRGVYAPGGYARNVRAVVSSTSLDKEKLARFIEKRDKYNQNLRENSRDIGSLLENIRGRITGVDRESDPAYLRIKIVPKIEDVSEDEYEINLPPVEIIKLDLGYKEEVLLKEDDEDYEMAKDLSLEEGSVIEATIVKAFRTFEIRLLGKEFVYDYEKPHFIGRENLEKIETAHLIKLFRGEKPVKKYRTSVMVLNAPPEDFIKVLKEKFKN